MGWPMAANLRRKIGGDRELVICDVSHDAISRFQTGLREHGPIKVVSSGREAFEAAVWQACLKYLHRTTRLSSTPGHRDYDAPFR